MLFRLDFTIDACIDLQLALGRWDFVDLIAAYGLGLVVSSGNGLVFCDVLLGIVVHCYQLLKALVLARVFSHLPQVEDLFQHSDPQNQTYNVTVESPDFEAL